MTSGLKIAIASSGPAQFAFFRETLTDMGHVPVAYLTSRTLRPAQSADSEDLEYAQKILSDLPGGMDLLLPGTPAAVATMLAGYEPDLLLVSGFNWRLPREVLELPRLGALNVHPSALPKYRGPSPVPWTVRNGDPFMGLTIHRMVERIDAGPILAQTANIPVPEVVSSQVVWDLIRPVLRELLPEAVNAAARGEQGTPQDESRATYAGFPPPEWREVTWKGRKSDLHNQIRVLRFLNRGEEPVVPFQGKRVRVIRSSLTPDGGTRIECEDGPLWLTYTEPSPSSLCFAGLQYMNSVGDLPGSPRQRWYAYLIDAVNFRHAPGVNRTTARSARPACLVSRTATAPGRLPTSTHEPP